MRSHSPRTGTVSQRILCVFASIKVTRSSLLPTAMVFPSGDHVMLMFSPLVVMDVTGLLVLASHILTVLSPEAVANKSALIGCQQSWSTESVCPLNTWSFVNLSWPREKIQTVLS